MNPVTILTDIFAASLFRTDAEGRRVFSPNAMSTKRYIIPDAATEQALRRRMGWTLAASIVTSIVLIAMAYAVFGTPHDWSAAVWLGLGAVFAIQFYLNTLLGKRLLRGLDGVDTGQPVGFLRAMADQVLAWPRWLCWLEALTGPLVLTGGILGLNSPASTYELTMAILAIPLGLVMSAFGWFGLLARPSRKAA
jgi:hypothetical protein